MLGKVFVRFACTPTLPRHADTSASRSVKLVNCVIQNISHAHSYFRLTRGQISHQHPYILITPNEHYHHLAPSKTFTSPILRTSASTKMATTRLRQTFHYPHDSDSDSGAPEGLDEEEQENLITHLAASDASNTQLYTYLLLLLPLLPLFLYIRQLFSTTTFIPSVCAISSLVATAYTLYYIPLPPASASSTLPSKGSGKAAARDFEGRKAWLDITGGGGEDDGPVKKYIVPLNLALCVVLALQELVARRGWREGMMVGGGYVPGFVFAVIMFARNELRRVDLGDLERLRYRYKGA